MPLARIRSYDRRAAAPIPATHRQSQKEVQTRAAAGECAVIPRRQAALEMVESKTPWLATRVAPKAPAPPAGMETVVNPVARIPKTIEREAAAVAEVTASVCLFATDARGS